jgi:predicted TIM-barrel fold metal-dependent hydrolase
MEIIDFHVHVYGYTKEEDLLGPMDQLGISRSVLLAVDHGPQGIARGTNVADDIVACHVQRHPDRFIGFTSVHPDSPDIVARVRSAVDDLGFRGIKLYPHAGFSPDDARLGPVLQFAEERAMTVIVHTGIKALPQQRMKFNIPLHVDEIAVAFPGLRIIIAHSAYPWVDEALLVARLNRNVFIDITFLDVLDAVMGEPVFDSVLRRAKRVLGCERVVWGTEGLKLDLEMYPDAGLDRMARALSLVRWAPYLSNEEKGHILSGNAHRLLA